MSDVEFRLLCFSVFCISRFSCNSFISTNILLDFCVCNNKNIHNVLITK